MTTVGGTIAPRATRSISRSKKLVVGYLACSVSSSQPILGRADPSGPSGARSLRALTKGLSLVEGLEWDRDERYGRMACMIDRCGKGRRKGKPLTMYKSARATPVGASATAWPWIPTDQIFLKLCQRHTHKGASSFLYPAPDSIHNNQQHWWKRWQEPEQLIVWVRRLRYEAQSWTSGWC